jgi:hypothetical protein
MTTRAAKPDSTHGAMPEPEESHQSEVDAFIARNQEALNASIRRSRGEMSRGLQSRRTIDDIIADGRKGHS